MAVDADEAARAFYELSKHLKRIGQTELRKQMNREMLTVAKPLIPHVTERAAAVFPSRNGLAKSMARKSRYRAQARTGAATAGVRIIANRTDPRVDSEGRVAHPIFGRKGKAANGGRNTAITRVPGAVGYFTDTITEHAPEVRDALGDALLRWAVDNLREGLR